MVVTQLCPTLCHPMDYTVHGILQARLLEWVVFPFSRDLPNPWNEPRSPALQADSLSVELPGKQAKWIFILLYKCFVQILWRWRLRWRTGCRWWGKGYLSIEALYAFKQKSTLHLEVVVVYLFVLALACFPGLIRNILKWEFYFVYFSCLS